ncbi:MAG: hypothetical protein HOC71_05820 [Candidatus Latescibacteria bacterium]|jgi:hypothetical protein|nr:hypothetical protein [Candidatus Latescibacterota bacterium]
MANNKQLIDAILEETFRDGEKVKLPCAAAFKIAAKFGVKPSEIGDVCNERNIRISRCQLGCF